MKLIENFLEFHKVLKKRHEEKRYNDLLKKRPFIEIEDDNSFTIQDLIEEGFLDFISLDIVDDKTSKYTVHLSDKALVEIKKVKQV
jgi:hypothetical protein